MFKNLLSKEELITKRNFLNPCPKIRIVKREESVSQEEEEIHELDPQEGHIEVFLNHPCKHI